MTDAYRAAADDQFEAELDRAYKDDPEAFRCPNPFCDGTGWVTAGATAANNAYRAPVCTVGPHA